MADEQHEAAPEPAAARSDDKHPAKRVRKLVAAWNSKGRSEATSKAASAARTVWNLGLVVALVAIGSATYLISSGKVCGLDRVGKASLEGIHVCDASAQLRMAIDTGNEAEVREVIAVLAEDDRASKEALAALLTAREEAYLAALATSGRDPVRIEATLKNAGYYNTGSPVMAADFGRVVEEAIGAGSMGGQTMGSRRLLSTQDYQKARKSVAGIRLLDTLREDAAGKTGAFYPLGVERLASLPGQDHPSKCEVHVKDPTLNGVYLRIEGHGDGVVVRQARNVIPEVDSMGRDIEVDLHVNSGDAETLGFPNFPKRQDTVFVREATREDLRLLDRDDCAT